MDDDCYLVGVVGVGVGVGFAFGVGVDEYRGGLAYGEGRSPSDKNVACFLTT